MLNLRIIFSNCINDREFKLPISGKIYLEQTQNNINRLWPTCSAVESMSLDLLILTRQDRHTEKKNRIKSNTGVSRY